MHLGAAIDAGGIGVDALQQGQAGRRLALPVKKLAQCPCPAAAGRAPSRRELAHGPARLLYGPGRPARGRSRARVCRVWCGHAGKDDAMLQERIEGKWIEAFAAVFRRCDVTPGLEVAILSETQSRPVTVALAELALAGARRPALSRRGAHAAAARGRSHPIDGGLRRAPGQQARGERARPVGHGRRLHRRGPAPRARAAADPGRRRARPHDLERASRGPRAACPHRRPRGQGEGGDPPAARGEADARHVAIGHGPARLARGRGGGRRLGVYDPAGHRSRTGRAGSASAFPRAAASPGAW